VFCENGAASFDQRRPSEIQLFLREGKSAQAGYRQIILGPEHPYLSGGLAMDAPSVGFGQNDAFAYQARAFLEEVAGIDEASSLPRCATFDEGVHNMELLAAVAESASTGGSCVAIADQGKVSA
jgi:predicted dehydrogenase